ncbi:MAG: hypothetical protein ABSE62_11220 [Chthoniobacteraceae bacterium]|jgi:hypothetical protein
MKATLPVVVAVFGFSSVLRVCAQERQIPESVQSLRQAGPLDVQLRTDTGRDVHLRLDEQDTTQELGDRLTTEQIAKLDTIRAEAPDKYQILSCLFPRQIAEFLLRSPSAKQVPPADDAVQRLVWEIAADYISEPENPSFTDEQRRARADFIKASIESLPPEPAPIQHLLEQASQYEDPDFDSPEKASAFLILKDWYSPYRTIGMSMVGDILSIDGTVVTEHLSADAAAAGQSPEQYAYDYYNRYAQALEHWRSGQITGDAYAGTIRRFLNDPRLAEFTPEEVSRAYQRVFGRDLKTDLEADRIAARLGHPVTYNQLHDQAAKE